MLRATANNTVGNRSSLEATLALWTPRNYGSNARNPVATNSGIPAKQQPLAQPQQQQQQHLVHSQYATPRFNQKRHFIVRPGASRGAADNHQVDVLNKLPSLFARAAAANVAAPPQQQQQQSGSNLLPLLHSNKQARQHQQQPHHLLLLHQPLPATQEAELIDGVEAEFEAMGEKLRGGGGPGKSRFRISVRERPTPQQPPPQQEPQRTMPIAYFTRASGSLRSARVDDPDARSCDFRHPDQTVAYSRAADYIRDNELMSVAKVRLIWRWIDELEDSGATELFAYDHNDKWFVQSDDESL